MEGVGCSLKEKAKSKHKDLLDLVFSWSLEDIFNEELYKDQVEKIPESFESVQHYLGSFVYPLLEEIRAELASSLEAISSAPFAEVVLNESKPSGALLYDVKVDYWRNSSSHHGQESYKALPGDFFVFTEAKPETVSDLQRVGRTWTFGSITKIAGDDNNSMGTNFKVKVSNDLEVEDGKQKFLYMVFLMNITTNKRIWNALHRFGNLEVIKKVLCIDTLVEEICDLCPVKRNEICAEKLGLSSTLNKSQYEAVVDSICKMQCNHKSFVKLIWGPPGTGKTRTLSLFLWNLLGLKCRTLVCAPTNAAITEVASRVLELVKQSFDDAGRNALFCCLGDILLFGNKQQMKVCSDFEEIYLDYRVEKLAQCLGPVDGWKHCFASMIEFFEGFVSWYQKFCGNDLIDEKEVSDQNEDSKVESKLFLGSVRENFETSAFPLRRCVSIFCTHLPKSLILEHNFRIMVSLIALLDSFETLLLRYIVVSEVEFFSHSEMIDDSPQFLADTSTILYRTIECLTVLRSLQKTLNELNLPCTVDKGSLVDFCFKMASSIFCTASSSYKLHSVVMEPLQLLVIDEAAQLKECESIIPLQLPGTRDAILIGDEFQLPAIVNSNVSDKAGFGRSLFERMSLLGHPKHLLDTQYRMHPSISLFPNSKFYNNQIIDAPNVKNKNYKKCHLPGPMFGPYSFINISGGKEMLDVRHSRKNMVEVAVVLKIVQMLYKACNESKEMLSVGVVSPYAAQVAAIQQKLGQKYENHCRFTVKVKSIDRYQGGEDDIIILSTIRSTSGGSIGFISSPHRTNVALTRARNCLWILGNEKTLTNSGSVWKELITDAKVRQCYFNADEDELLTKVIVEVKKELDELDDLLNGDSILFKAARWKVLFSDIFRRSFVKLKSSKMRNLVLLLLLKLCNGWRPKRSNVDIICESSFDILRKFKVQGLYIICSVDIVKELWYIQVLKVWDILPLEDIPKLVRRLDGIFGMYTDDYLNHCKVKCFEGDLLVPATWASSADIVQYKDLSNTGSEKVSNDDSFDRKVYVEDSKVNDSLLLMKFYSLSSGVVSHLLSGCDGRELGLPFELTDQEKEIIFFNRSTFILGRSGTGKTTVLTMKLFQNEQLYHIASEGFHEVVSNLSSNVSWRYKANESNGETKRDMLHQIFVTVSPKLCFAVKQHVSHLKSFVCGGDSSAGSTSIHMDDIDDTTQFFDIPDSFVDLPPKSYPLVITFHKFLMMLDGTVAVSYFERFPYVRQLCHGKNGNSRSIALETFIRTKEVNYHRFSWAYWPHFNIQITNKLESTRVFTEIMSVIKGGLRAGEDCDGKLSRQDYVLLSESRGSTLSRKKRERIYDIFLQYERKKVVDGDFDLADLVNDLHRRLKEKRFVADGVDFVYIDEVQDLSIRQIALFKYICRNVEGGFVFAGDTAQTIARGVDFRFEDIRCLFYKEFLRGSGPDVVDGRIEKGQISDIFHLSQNFRTHGGVLNLAQSVIDLLYHFFPLSIDILSPETSLLYGDAPILLDSKNKENVIRTIFRNGGTVDGNIVGFGAEQVILVRDDSLRKEICDYVGKKALVLTILECKGLEFQDVLLYNIFSSSPFKSKWRVIYEYMKERDLLDSNSPPSFPSFNQEKHNLLCSEMKQLYVAITRTKQRLWICENVDELSEPMFHYWKKLSIVQVRQLDDSFAKEMLVASSRDEWKSRGIKLFYEGNYKMAIMCFERAGDMYWERWAKAAELRVTADCMHGPNPEKSRILLKEAAEIFDSIGKAELAAQCFFKSEEYERAGKIYLEKCGDSNLDRAGECFSLAGCYKRAAEVYARAKSYTMCLSACVDGKLFDLGLDYIQSWKLHTEMDKIVLDFLQQGALYYYELKNNKAMIKFVESFHSMDSIRSFLKNLNCLDELLLMEKERGNFLEAADIAKLKKDLLLEADLVEKAGYFREASMLILWYVFSNSLHPLSSKCRPPKWLMQKDKLLTKAKSTAKNHSDPFYNFVCKEAEILSEEKINGNVFEMGLQFIQFWKQKAPTGVGRIKRGYEIDKIEQDMLERCAHHYHDLKDDRTMMRYVKAFHSEDLIRSFLKNLDCLDELLSMEKEWGNFLEAADIAKLKKDLLLESNLVEKAGYFREASMLILWYVFSNSLPPLSSKCRPPKWLMQKDKLLTKAKSTAKNHSDPFYDFVCKEAEILSEENINGNVFEMGLQFIQFWKQKAPTGVGRIKRGYEIDKIEQDMLERCAHHYHDLKDNRTMMRYVKAFHSGDLIRSFLKNLDCLDELLSMEKEWGNFLEAADIAKLKKDLLLESDLVEKAGYFREASMLILWYVFSNSLPPLSSKCRFPKQYTQKDELLTKAISIAKNDSDTFYDFVSKEAEILSETNINGNVFEMGLKFIQLWKQKAPTDVGRVKIGYEIVKIEQDMLERCAHHYHDLKDNRTMMKYIKAFHSSNLMRTFLMSLNCLDEVLLLEEEWGNFWQAAKIAKQKGYLLREAGLLEKAGHFDEACMVLLLYVFASSLWVSGSQGWPLKKFNQKEELLTMAKSCAKKSSDQFYEFVCMEVNILSNNESSLSEMMQNMFASQRLKSLGGEILSAWKILDDHLRSNTSKYEWNNFWVFDLLKHSEDMISQNQISVETLIYFWNFWKEKILNLVHYIRCIGTPDVSKYACYEEFCLNFMGVRKHDGNKNTIYLLLYSDAIWVREVDYRSLWGKGNLVSIDAHNFVSAALSYWCSELLSVGLKVLETLNTLYDYSLRNFFSLFQQTMSLLHICEVAKFLQENKFLNCRHNGELVKKSLELASRCHFGNVFPLDWRKSLIESMIFLRGSKLSVNLVSEAISRNISSKSPLTYGQLGRVVMMILGSGKLSNELYERIVRSFDGNLQWRAFIEEIVWNIVPDFKLGSATRNSSNASGEVSLVCRFHEAVEDTYYANWRTEQDYISPACFLYLVERLLILTSYFQGYIFTTKSSVVEWLIFQEWSINPSAISKNDTELSVILRKIDNSMACIVQELLLNKHDTMEWFETSKNSSDDYYPVLVLRLIVLLSLICVNSGKHFDKLFYLLGRSDITSVLPCEFCEALLRARKCYFIYALADALGKIENPLVLVSLGNNFSNFLCPDAIFINMEANRCGEEILRELFQKEGVTTRSRSGNPEKGFDLPLFNFAHAALNTQICNEAYPGKKCCLFWEIFYALETFEFRKGGNIMGFMSVASIIKVEVEKIFQLSSAAVGSCQENSYQNDNLLVEAKSMLAELKLLSFALDISERTLEDNISTIGKLSKSLQFRRPRLEPFLDHLFLQNETQTAI